MAIFVIDYENVYIEGMTGLEQLDENDEVVIFYTQNRCGLTFELHQRLNNCRAKLTLMEVTAISTQKNTVKNALDLQLSMYIGYLCGSRPDTPLYIISRDADFDLGLNFFSQYLQGSSGSSVVECATIEHALVGNSLPNTSQTLQQAVQDETDEKKEPPHDSDKAKKTGGVVIGERMREIVAELIGSNDKKVVHRICAIIAASQDLLALNNLLARYYHDGSVVKEIYHKLKPSFNALREMALTGE